MGGLLPPLPAALPSGMTRYGTHCIGGWVGPEPVSTCAELLHVQTQKPTKGKILLFRVFDLWDSFKTASS
jgi:hypothetical protein